MSRYAETSESDLSIDNGSSNAPVMREFTVVLRPPYQYPTQMKS